jgi:hypothetical protein
MWICNGRLVIVKLLPRMLVLSGLVLAAARPASGRTPLCPDARQSGTGAAGATVREAVAVRTATLPTIDGRLDEAVWRDTAPLSGFVQREPDEGKPATEDTEVRVLFDNEALYVGARMLDREPDRIVRRLSRRDGAAFSDSLTIILDPYHDHMTGAILTVSAAGALSDSLVANDTGTDASWDGVWEAAVSIDTGGWVAEIRIPLSQLRFAPGARQTWGFNISRYLQRRVESSYWNPFGANESRLISRCGHLTGLDGLVPRRHLDLLPYTSARLEQLGTIAPGNPFTDGTRVIGGGGLDLKWGVTSAFALDAAFNPDFGQVEADPAVVNLTAFETLFEERRPFFIEGMQLLRNFGQATGAIRARFGEDTPDLVYSRRIGRVPQGPASGDFVDTPASATILGATKLSGRTASGWSISVFDAMTGREFARTDDGGLRSRHQVEPFTNYFAARVRRELGPSAAIGGIATQVTRDLSEPTLLALLPRHAVTGGADAYLYLGGGRDWVLNGALTGSRVSGDAAAIARLQHASARYFQRPDARHVSFDASQTSMSGWTGHVELTRSNRDVLVSLVTWAISPGFESNDMGFQTGADRIGAHAFVIWQKARADRFTRFRYAGVAKFYNWNFGGERVGDGFYGEAVASLPNNWLLMGNAMVNRASRDDRFTRGGPIAARPSSRSVVLQVTTDERRAWSLNFGTRLSQTSAGNWTATVSPSLTVRPSPRLAASVGPEWARSRNTAQYVRAVADATATSTFGDRYVFADLDRTDVSMVVRFNAIFTPRTSLQIYAQPFVAAGHYWGLKEFSTPGAYTFDLYGVDGGSSTYDPAARRFLIDADGTGAAPVFSVPDPDFNVKSLRVNTVFRWEWRLGSTFYAVWTQQRADFANAGSLALGRDLSSLMRAPADNAFMIKVAYWFSR